MRVTILTYGSRGDVQPCLALPGFLRSLADEHGIPAVSLPGDIEPLSHGLNQAGKNPVKMIRAMQENVEPVALEVARLVWQACQTANLVVHTFAFTLGAHAFAGQLGIPDVSAQFFPMFITSAGYPQLAFPELRLGRRFSPRYNRLTHMIGSALFAVSQRAMYPPDGNLIFWSHATDAA